MAQKKSYSRYFIILQQDENGYSLSSDKLPSGYTKLETKSDKCKVSYYVQNLKKEMEPYYMVLICSKKDVKKLIKLGVMNIDEHGRAEITYEYSSANIAGSGIGIDMVNGAAVVKDAGVNIISVMSGFASADTPMDWRTYEVFENARDVKEDNKVLEEKKAVDNKIAEIIEVVESKVPAKEKTDEKREKQNNVFEDYEIKIEEIKGSQTDNVEEIPQQADNIIKNEQLKQETMQLSKATSYETTQEHKVEEDIEDIRKDDKNVESKEKIDEEIEYPTGTVGEFFKLVAEDFDEEKEVCKEIKRCKWYKVNVSNLEEMCNVSNYNKYTIVYYPMVSYFPYIKKQGHYLLGYKYDNSGRMKYIVYGIPGTRNLNDQPFGGKSGFVTWVSLKEGESRDGDEGYWLMFYDFRTSTIVIPVK